MSVGNANESAQPSSEQLAGISCVSARDCWAVGYSTMKGQGTFSRVLHWSGRKWTPFSVPDPRRSVLAQLSAVTCTSTRDCWAVGGYQLPSGPTVDEALRWNGRKWAPVPTPTPGTSNPYNVHFLRAVACTSATDCWAVGYSTNLDESNYYNQILHWNGSIWVRVPTPNPINQFGGTSNSLSGVACSAADDCWAVGADGKTNSNEIVHWNGGTWALSSVAAAPPSGRLDGISCVSANYCSAVGAYQNASDPVHLDEALRWNGTSWSSVPIPSPGKRLKKGTDYLHGVACTSAKDCWTVGDASANQNQAVHWNGGKWAEAQVPNTGQPIQSDLLAVACASASSCWAVGYKGSHNLALRWQKTRWVDVTVP